MPREVAESRAAIVAAALAVLRDHGPLGLTSDRIAKKATCAKGLINYHYPSRHELLVAMIASLSADLWRPRLGALDHRGSAVVDETWRVLVDEQQSGRHRSWAMLKTMRTSKLIDRSVSNVNRDAMESLSKIVRRWMQRSGFGGADHGDVARALAALFDGFEEVLVGVDPDTVYPAYLTAWLGLIASLSEARS